jgi:hypothetical protein
LVLQFRRDRETRRIVGGPRRAVKIAHLWALQNRTPVGGQFQNRTL